MKRFDIMHWLLNTPAGFDVAMIIAVILGVLVYVIPTLVAWSMSSKGIRWVAIINVLLGWTVIGWIIALIWALVASKDTSFDDEDVA